MIASSPGIIPTRRWRGFVAVVAFVAAAATACSAATEATNDADDDSGAAGETTGADESIDEGTADRTADDQIDLGRFEFSSGPGSLVVPITARLPEAEVLGDDWFAFPSETKAVESCRFDDEQAWAARSFSRTNGGESAAIRIGTFSDETAAAAALDLVVGPGWAVCIDDSLAQLNAKLDETGALSAELIGEIGEPGEPILTGRDGFSRSYDYALVGGGVQLDLKITETTFVHGNELITIQTALLGDEHVELTTTLAEGLGPDSDSPDSDSTDSDSPDSDSTDSDSTDSGDDGALDADVAAGLDANLAGLRRAVLAEDEAAPFYSLLLAARVSATGTIDCVPQDDPTVTMFGPTWSTVNGISAIIQLGRGYRTTEEAAEVLDGLEAIDPECLFENDLAGSFAGEVFFEDSAVSISERDGRRVLVVDISMTQRLNGNQAVDAEVAAITTMTLAGTELVGWRFVGIRGDEPDLVQMTIDAAARAEGAS